MYLLQHAAHVDPSCIFNAVVADVVLLVCRKVAILLKVGEMASINYLNIHILMERNSLRNFLLSLPCLLKCLL